MIELSLLLPSRNRPQQAKETLNKWMVNAKDLSRCEVILSTDTSDKNIGLYKRLFNNSGVIISINNNKSAIEAINASAKISTGRIIVQIAEDFNEPPKHWDELILKEVEGKEDFVLKTQDGIQPYIVTLPIMDRNYYNRFGYIYENGYSHLWCDSELFCVAWMMDKIIMSDLMIKHNHYSTGKTKKDRVNLKNDSTWKQGKNLFYERKKTNFGLKPEEIKKEFPYFAGYNSD